LTSSILGHPQGMRVIVTGATGNVGTATLRELIADDAVDEVVGIARRLPELRLPKVRWVAADVSRDDLAPVFAGADVVVHLAWLIQPSRDESVTYATNVEGSRRVFAAAAAAGAAALVYASSIGAYAPGPKDRPVDESWPTTGVPSSFYSRHKAATERLLDELEIAHPELRVVRLRPGLIFGRDAATGIRRLFAGPLLPTFLLRPGLIPILPLPDRMVVQAVHRDDVARAYRMAVLDETARGAYNIAADPVLDQAELGRVLGARPVRVPARVLRAAAGLAWRLRLQPTSPDWLDMGLAVPVMDTTRARDELGWRADRSSGEALLDLLEGMRSGAGVPTPPLDPATSGPARMRELLTGVGQTSK
jgi:UDP-glucose 4-epimerase